MNFPLVRDWRIFSTVLLLALLPSLNAADLDALRAAARGGDQKAMRQLFEQLANGDAKAKREAFSWYCDLGRAGDVKAAVGVARLYTNGDPTIELEADLSEAEEYYYLALKKTDDVLPEVIGFFNGYRLREPQYHKFALERLLKLAGDGNAIAQIIAAQTYIVGAIVPKDDAKGLEWLGKAVAQKNEQARMTYADFLIKGIAMTANPAAGMRLLTDLANEGSATASFYAGVYYLNSPHVKPDPQLAAQYLNLAADDLPEAALEYAKLLSTGTGVTKDPAAALDYWLELAPDFPEAAYRAGIAYRDGNGAARNLKTAATYLNDAKRGGYAEAAAALAGVERDMPVNFVVRDKFLLDGKNAVPDGNGCYVQIYSYRGKAGDEVAAEVAGRVYDTIHVYKTDITNLRLLVDDGSGKFQPVPEGRLNHSVRLKKDGRVQFMVATRKPGQTSDAMIEFGTTRTTAAGEPPVVTRHTGTDHTLARGAWNVLTLNTNGASGPQTISVESRAFDPVLEAGPTVSDANYFSATVSDDNSGGGTTARLPYSPGTAEKFMIKIHDRGDDQGGAYRVFIDRALPWRDTRSMLF